MYSKRNCACGNAEWRKSACTARGIVPAEIEDGGKVHVQQEELCLRKLRMAEKRMYGKRNCACGNAEWRKSACKASGIIPAEIEDGGKVHVQQADMYLRK